MGVGSTMIDPIPTPTLPLKGREEIFMSSSRLARRAFTVCLIAASPVALAQDYPTRPVRLVVAAAPGGGTDISARLIAPKLTEYLGRPVVGENRPPGAPTHDAAVVARKDRCCQRNIPPPPRWGGGGGGGVGG